MASLNIYTCFRKLLNAEYSSYFFIIFDFDIALDLVVYAFDSFTIPYNWRY